MNNYLFSVEAIGTMLTECFRRGSNLEAGGILVGPKRTRIVTHAIASTESAERLPTTFYQTPEDIAVLNQQLRQHQAEGRDLLGYFHRHPSGMSSLSQTDLQTCKGILTSPHYDINNQLLMLILTETEAQELPIFPTSSASPIAESESKLRESK